MKNIARIAVSILACTLFATPVHAQLAKSGKSAESLVPQGWEQATATGDINKDGFADLLLEATPNDSTKMEVRDDGYVYNYNQPILAIYWGSADGTFTLWKQYPTLLPHQEDEFTSYGRSYTITDKGILRISIDPFSSAGSWENGNTTFVYRYQNGDLYLIGEDQESTIRNTGETCVVSKNYLTNKQQTVRGRIDSDKTRETWKSLPRRPLQRLGEHAME